MATRKKEIKKPSFIITYAVCLLVSLIIVGGFGAAIGVSQYYLFYVRAWGNMVGLDADLTTEICNFLSTDKEDITREKIVWLKWVILNHYSETGRCAEELCGIPDRQGPLGIHPDIGCCASGKGKK